jgi:hypothetical protein
MSFNGIVAAVAQSLILTDAVFDLRLHEILKQNECTEQKE